MNMPHTKSYRAGQLQASKAILKMLIKLFGGGDRCQCDRCQAVKNVAVVVADLEKEVH